MKLTSLISLGVSGVGVATGTGVAISYYYGGESIREHISNGSAKNKKFISLVPDAQKSLIDKYSLVRNHKPKDGSQEVPKDKIVEWCESSSNTKFSSEEDSVYLSIDNWCFVDITSFAERAKGVGKEYISEKDGNDDAWKSAWDSYNGGKSIDNLRINDDSLVNLNNQDQAKGAIDLEKWCKKTSSVKMYEVGAEDNYNRYEKWCFKPKQ